MNTYKPPGAVLEDRPQGATLRQACIIDTESENAEIE